MDNIILYTFLLLAIIGLFAQFFLVKRRHDLDYNEHIKPFLEEKGLQFISSEFPGWFKIGPFPKIEVESGRPQSNVPFFGKGEFSQYRIVTVSDSDGQEYRIWALLEFEIFQLRHIRWRVEKDYLIPSKIETIIEN